MTHIITLLPYVPTNWPPNTAEDKRATWLSERSQSLPAPVYVYFMHAQRARKHTLDHETLYIALVYLCVHFTAEQELTG
mgnify:CR=1 FL=1